jgi:hypothetical protein
MHRSLHLPIDVRWIRTGAVTGILAVLVYTGIVVVPFSPRIGLVAALSFGVLLIVAFIGLHRFIALHQRTVALDLAAVFGVIAGAVVDLMFVVQIAVKTPLVGESVDPGVAAAREIGNRVQLGLDVGWDVFVGLATLLFAWCALRHPRLGPWLGVPGLLIAVLLLALNLQTFPFPPSESGSFDAGPLVGLWYLLISIRVLQSLTWAREAAATLSAYEP